MKDSKLFAVNPVYVLFLGACPAMAATAGLIPALLMGVSLLAVMLVSAIVLSVMKKLIPGKGIIACALLLSAVLVSALQMLFKAFVPTALEALGVYFAAAAMSLLVLYNAEEAVSSSFGAAILKSLGLALQFIVILAVSGLIREFFGFGTVAGNAVGFMKNFTCQLFAQPAGGFLVFAVMLAIVNKLAKVPAKPEGLAAAAAGTAPSVKE